MLEALGTNLSKGVYIRTRSDGKLFNLARLKSSTKTREICVRDLLYADDSALVSTDPEEIQEIVEHFAMASTMFGLTIKVSKTELLYQPPLLDHQPQCPDVLLNGRTLAQAESFVYLGSAVTSTNSSDLEVDRRIQAASKAFGSLYQRLWSRHDIKRTTKIKVYNAAVQPALLYSTECMILYRRHIKVQVL